MAQSYKLCPICGTAAHRNAVMCSTCGTSLTDVQPTSDRPKTTPAQPAYDRRYGETDLLEGEVSNRGQVFILGGLLTVALLLCGAIVLFVGQGMFNNRPAPTPTTANATQAPVLGQESIVVTNTPRPTVIFATVTPPPPSPTLTPTEGPCVQHVDPGDDLISMAWACGHRSLDVMPLILEMNDLASAELIQLGQDILIPRPTLTADPNAGAAGPEALTVANASTAAPTDEAPLADAVDLQDPLVMPTETLLPGIMWHQVQPNETMLVIASTYRTSAEVLAQLNPEITFSQCDYSLDSGGPTCTVLLVAGQNMRVPAPTPTPTLSPTLSGSETPTPTLTPTFNAPNLFNPPDRALFQRDALITLRWVGTGTLGADEVYVITMEDLTANTTYTGETDELYFIVPPEWQGTDARWHDFRWSISVVRHSSPNQPIFTTGTRLFTWESRNE